jgi:hypothetical protein
MSTAMNIIIIDSGLIQIRSSIPWNRVCLDLLCCHVSSYCFYLFKDSEKVASSQSSQFILSPPTTSQDFELVEGQSERVNKVLLESDTHQIVIMAHILHTRNGRGTKAIKITANSDSRLSCHFCNVLDMVGDVVYCWFVVVDKVGQEWNPSAIHGTREISQSSDSLQVVNGARHSHK